jgi:TetR/AcrR family transcriptional regulator, transcriptional repressor for nem operon
MLREPATQIDPTVTTSFRDWVSAKQKSDTTRRKGEKTRDRIRLATIELLNSVGYVDLKVSDICRRAKITAPVLYLYFDGKEPLVRDVLTEFLSDFMSRSTSSTARSAYRAIYDANLHWLRAARSNAGLMKCLLQFSDQAPEFAKLFAEQSNQWYLRIAQSIIRRFPAARNEVATIHLVLHALGAMMDELTRKIFAGDDKELNQLIGGVAPDDESLAGFLSLIWYRALYGADPPATESRPLITRLKRTSEKAITR